ncbi:MAG: flagellar hook-length control protein FliK, partial [Candidatus Latescibacterota bacterium]
PGEAAPSDEPARTEDAAAAPPAIVEVAGSGTDAQAAALEGAVALAAGEPVAFQPLPADPGPEAGGEGAVPAAARLPQAWTAPAAELPNSGASSAAQAPGAGEPRAPAPVQRPAFLDLLTPAEVTEPGLTPDPVTPAQVMARLQEAVASPAGPLLDGMDEVGQSLVPQVLRGLVTLVRGGTAEMRLQLQPPDLGELEVRVRTSEGTVHGQLVVEHAHVKQLLDAQVDRLRQALWEQGLQLRGFEVSVGHDPRRHPSGQTAPRRAARAGRPRAGAPEAVARVRAAPVGSHAVDYTI